MIAEIICCLSVLVGISLICSAIPKIIKMPVRALESKYKGSDYNENKE